MAVYGILRHHAFREHTLPDPDLDQVPSQLADNCNAVQALDLRSDGLARTMMERLAANNVHASTYQSSDDHATLEASKVLEAYGLIAPIELGRSGIRFHVSLGQARRPLGPAERTTLNRDLLALAEDVSSRFLRNGHLPSPISVYHGAGTFTTHLLTCKAPDGVFYAFSDALVRRIHAEAFVQTYRMKPSTSVYSTRDVLVADERATTTEDRVFTSKELAAAPPESRDLEYKASAWFDFHRALRDMRPEALPTFYSFDAGLDIIAKSVCGFLNSGAGAIVIGVVEEDAVVGNLRRFTHEQFADAAALLECVPINPTAARDRLWIVGLNADYSTSDRPKIRNWDTWRNGVTDKLSSSIQPNPMSTGEVTVTPLSVDEIASGKVVAVIRVRKRVDPERWFYANHQFFIRQDGNTVPLYGQDTDKYKRLMKNRATGQ